MKHDLATEDVISHLLDSWSLIARSRTRNGKSVKSFEVAVGQERFRISCKKVGRDDSTVYYDGEGLSYAVDVYNGLG